MTNMKGGSFTISTTLVGRKSWIQFLSIRKLIYKVQLRGVGARIDTQCEPLLLILDISILYFSLYFLANFLDVMRHSCFFDCFYTAALTVQLGWLTLLIHVPNRHQSFQVIDVQAAILNRKYSGFLFALAPLTIPVSDALLLRTIFMRRNTTTSHVTVSKNILQFEVYKCIFQKCCNPNITKRDHFASFLWTKTVMEPDRAIMPSLILESAHSIQTTFGVRLTAIFD